MGPEILGRPLMNRDAALLAAGAGLAALGALPAVASLARVVPNTAAGIVRIFHPHGMRLSGRDPTYSGITAGNCGQPTQARRACV